MTKDPRKRTITRDLRSRRINITQASLTGRPSTNRRQRKSDRSDRSHIVHDSSFVDIPHEQDALEDLVQKVKNYKTTIASLKGVVDKAKQEKAAISQRKIRLDEEISNRTRGKLLLANSVIEEVGKESEEVVEKVVEGEEEEAKTHEPNRDDTNDDAIPLTEAGDDRLEDHFLTDNEGGDASDINASDIDEADFDDLEDHNSDVQDEANGNTGLFTPPHSTSHPSRAKHRYQPYTRSSRVGIMEQTLQTVSWKTHEHGDRISRLENKCQKLFSKFSARESEDSEEEGQERRDKSRGREETSVKTMVAMAAFGFGAGIATMNIGRALASGFSI